MAITSAKLAEHLRMWAAIPINEQWRIGFRFAEGDAYDVEITDYH